MFKWLKILLTGIIVSFFYFPVNFTFFPIITKNILAAIGIISVGVILIRKSEFTFPIQLIILLLLASSVSIVSLLSITYNQTPDYTFVSYIRSATIWVSAAFTVCCCIWLTHKRIDIPLVISYLAAVGVFQCAITMAIHYIPAVQLFVDSTFAQGQRQLQDMGRLYGIGASLDVGGSRFAGILIGIAYMMEQRKDQNNWISQFLLVLSFCIITVIGNMIARTTVVGVIIGLAYIVLTELRSLSMGKNPTYKSSVGVWLLVLAAIVPLASFLYNTSEDFHDLMRFGFEGFFSLFEKGEWDVSSNNRLESMIVWPEELRTWIIGDGYFANQRHDANYIGEVTAEGFYMGTDIGYLRYIFYFGLIGLTAISSVMIYAGIVPMSVFPQHVLLFVMSILCNFVVWLKVSTDMFPLLSLYAATAFLFMELERIKELDDNKKERFERQSI